MKPSKPTHNNPSNTLNKNKFILGDGKLGLKIAQLLKKDGHTVNIVNKTYESNDIPGTKGDPTNIDTLKKAGLEKASIVIIVTQSDTRNFLIAQQLHVHFNIPKIIVLVNNPKLLTAHTKAGHKPLCVSTALYNTIKEYI